MRTAALLLGVLAIGCSASSMTADDTGTRHDTVSVSGPLRFAVSDFVTQGGVFWALPSITPAVGAVEVENTRYGSLCRFDVTAAAQTLDNQIALHVRFDERLTQCTAEIRALQYTAVITEPPGTYDVTVIHHVGTSVDTLRRQTVIVR
jgi:hypothetical protein